MIKSRLLSNFKNISHGFFNSEGGYSNGIYKSLNCGIGSKDKKRIVSDVKEMAAEASSLVLADARGLTVSEATELRSEGHKANVKFRVAKNTLVKLLN